jgi:hypothetical protein
MSPKEIDLMPATSAPLEAFGFKTLNELAAETGAPAKTLRNWIHVGAMHAVRVDGVLVSTSEEVRRAAATRMTIGRKRSWSLEPA